MASSDRKLRTSALFARLSAMSEEGGSAPARFSPCAASIVILWQDAKSAILSVREQA